MNLFKSQLARSARLSIVISVASAALALTFGAPAALAQQYAYVANTGCSFTECVPSRTVSVINLSDNTVVSDLQVGNVPYEIAFTPDGKRAYITNEDSNSLSVVDVSSATVSATLPVGDAPVGVEITPDGTRAYVVSQKGYVWVFGTNPSDSATYNKVVATIGVGNTPTYLAITPDGKRVYVVVSYSDTVAVIDTATNTVIANVGVGSVPMAVAITPDGTQAYVTSYFGGYVAVISTSTNSITTTIGVGGYPYLIAITPDGTRAYVANEGSTSVSVIDISTNTVVGEVEIGSTTCGIAFSPDGNHAYVTTWPSSVSMVDTNPTDPNYNTMVGMVQVGNSPVGIAIAPVNNRPPVAQAGPDQTVECSGHNCSTVTLNGAASSDPDGDVLTYNWTDSANNSVGTAASVTVSAPLGATAYTLTVTDPGGLSSSAIAHVTVQDTTPPVLTLSQTSMAVVLPTASASGATVNLSGIATATDICDASPTITNNAPTSFPVGTTIVTFTATDHSGNQSQKNFSVRVVDNFNGYFSPLLNTGASLFQSGRTIPVKFALTAADGTIVSNAVANLQVYFVLTTPTGTVDETVNTLPSGSSNTGTLFRFDPTSGQYIYNLSTSGFASGTYLLRTTLNDGTTHDVNFSIR